MATKGAYTLVEMDGDGGTLGTRTDAIYPPETAQDFEVLERAWGHCAHSEDNARRRKGRVLVECRQHDPDGGTEWRGIYGHIKKTPSGLWAFSHFDKVHGDHVTSPGEAEHHKQWKHHLAKRGERHWRVEIEWPPRDEKARFRNDVTMFGNASTIGFEAQDSALSTRIAENRTRYAKEDYDVDDVWAVGNWTPPNTWWRSIPSFSANVKFDGGHIVPETWRVGTGWKRLVKKRCHSRYWDHPCPLTGRNTFCDNWHPDFAPVHKRTIDDVIELMPAGELVALYAAIPRRATYLVSVSDAIEYHAMTEWFDSVPPERRIHVPRELTVCTFNPAMPPEPVIPPVPVTYSEKVTDAAVACRDCDKHVWDTERRVVRLYHASIEDVRTCSEIHRMWQE